MNIAKIRNVKTPTRGTRGSAGIDFYIPNDYPENLLKIEPSCRCFIPSGIKANVPDGFALIAFNKSGVSLKKGLLVGACVVDSDYQGEIHLHMINASDRDVYLEAGEKLVQFLLVPIDHCAVTLVDVDELFIDNQSERGEGGFGSTGAQ